MAYIFGKNTSTGSRTDYSADEIICNVFTYSGGSATVRSMYALGLIDQSDDVRLAIYDASLNLLGETKPLPDTPPVFGGWAGGNLIPQVNVSGTNDYYLAVHSGTTVVGIVANQTLNPDTRDATGQTWSSGAPDPFPTDENNYGTRQLAIYTDDAVIPETLTADAVVFRAGQSNSFAADAYIVKAGSGVITADAIVKKTISASITANAIVAGEGEDAVAAILAVL